MNDEIASGADLKFFTNAPDESLVDRFKRTLQHTKYLDVIVGYFRSSGFHLLKDSFEGIDKIRILIGMGIDRDAFEVIEETRHQKKLDFESDKKVKKRFQKCLVREMDTSKDSKEVEDGIRTFTSLLEEGRLEVRAYPGKQLHAKVYITRYDQDDHTEYGNVITGSSNFSVSGLQGNREFNVQLKDSPDVKFALQQFEDLWKDSVPVSDDYVQTVRRKTWLNDEITPYELYLKFLYEYFEEEINADRYTKGFLPDDFEELEYQKQAVISAQKILEAHGGVFLADVVGLGKTFIAALLAQKYDGPKLVLCPPVLEDYWNETFGSFKVTDYEVESHGKLHHILEKGKEYEVVFVDEAHRFRNELTQGYEMLHEICFGYGEKVVLVTATPLNNTIEDIYSQLKLFQLPRKSTIPGVRDLKDFFGPRITRLNRYNRSDPEYAEILQEVSEEVREHVLKYVMVRRTRTEIENHYKEDLKKQNISFPDVKKPNRLIYEFDDHTNQIFEKTLERLKQFSYARYTPLLYLKKELTPLQKQSQKNVGGFMKVLLVKRLESSFHAFRRSVKRFIESYENFIEMVNDGTVYIGKDVDIFKLLDQDDEEKIQENVEKGDLEEYDSSKFSSEFLEKLEQDLEHLNEIKKLWKDVDDDPKLEAFLDQMQNDPILQDQQILIFSESRETGEYLYDHLHDEFGEEVIQYSSHGGHHDGESISQKNARKLIQRNFDPNNPKQQDQLRILISTDLLSEGINLHRSNVVINYDLPWNPTKVLQRVGRVNRVGTEHDTIHLYNIFPTAASDHELGLEQNITTKIQAFHDILGEDARYLTEEEEIGSHNLFGQALLEKLEDPETYQGEAEEGPSELAYLEQIRELQEEDPEKFEKIKNLPKKARSARAEDLEEDTLITFFRKGRLKKFYLSNSETTEEKTFFEAADLLKCEPSTSREEIKDQYFDLLNQNKTAFQSSISNEDKPTTRKGGRTNEQYIIKILESNNIQYCKTFTESDEEFIESVLKAFYNGIVPRKTSQEIKRRFKEDGVDEPIDILKILRQKISKRLLRAQENKKRELEELPREVILSELIISNFPD